MNPRTLLLSAAGRLRAAGVGSPRTDAELLLAHVLGVSRTGLFLVDSVAPDDVARFESLVDRRADREPLQHILGVAHFAGVDLAVGPGVFIPRPETEVLAAWGIEQVKGVPSPVVVDLCSGSGALALAVAHARPDATVYAVERSPAALEWLRRNASGSPVRVVAADVRDVDLPAPPAHLVLANPPYVPDSVRVPQEVLADPREAVFAGADGLDLIPALAATAARLLRDGGRVGVEHDESHPDEVAEILRGFFHDVRGLPDLAGRPRFTVGTLVR
ncbi:peptide chain release factor N(5)-glutamine methyltransferase [Hamadaea tsunoensis]|uniref:peptide chain release factor N(5)-glutamine methyltransferase n=1 Tax=Hamadaea tsunoensis TaxID=53368 RepID=UPI00041EFFFA|nr:peptide chain release factor N(5)-glutamine methyltransferase [Hamadaea tsunoensis]